MQKETIYALSAIGVGIGSQLFLTPSGKFSVVKTPIVSEKIINASGNTLAFAGATYLVASNVFKSQHPLRTTFIVVGLAGGFALLALKGMNSSGW
jgi:uncharacterized YccA/Bax inhibitor family protein